MNSAWRRAKSEGMQMTIDLQTVGREIGPLTGHYNWRDTALYAIGLSAGTDDLSYLVENPPTKYSPLTGSCRHSNLSSSC